MEGRADPLHGGDEEGRRAVRARRPGLRRAQQVRDVRAGRSPRTHDPTQMSKVDAVVPAETVQATIDAFTSLDQSGDRGAMNELARRLGKEQPALLQFAARVKVEHGDALGEAAVFYGTLVWAMFERHLGKKLPRLLAANLTDAKQTVDDERGKVEGLDEKPVQDRVAPGVVSRQPHLLAKLQELIAEDVKENALPADGAAV